MRFLCVLFFVCRKIPLSSGIRYTCLFFSVSLCLSLVFVTPPFHFSLNIVFFLSLLRSSIFCFHVFFFLALFFMQNKLKTLIATVCSSILLLFWFPVFAAVMLADGGGCRWLRLKSCTHHMKYVSEPILATR